MDHPTRAARDVLAEHFRRLVQGPDDAEPRDESGLARAAIYYTGDPDFRRSMESQGMLRPSAGTLQQNLDRRSSLVLAASLLIAAIDRIDRGDDPAASRRHN